MPLATLQQGIKAMNEVLPNLKQVGLPRPRFLPSAMALVTEPQCLHGSSAPTQGPEGELLPALLPFSTNVEVNIKIHEIKLYYKKECNTKRQLQTLWKQLPVLCLPLLQKKSAGVPRCLYHTSEPDPTSTTNPPKSSPTPGEEHCKTKLIHHAEKKTREWFASQGGNILSRAWGNSLPFLSCCKKSDTKYKFLENIRKKKVEEPCSKDIESNKRYSAFCLCDGATVA